MSDDEDFLMDDAGDEDDYDFEYEDDGDDGDGDIGGDGTDLENSYYMAKGKCASSLEIPWRQLIITG
jgi:COP9 signalosome complex subunit 2